MLETLPDFLRTYWMYLAGIVLACGIAARFSKKFLAGLKKTVLVLLVLFALVAGYEVVTGKNIFRLPADVDKKLSERPTNPESGHRYYVSPEERYGRELPQE